MAKLKLKKEDLKVGRKKLAEILHHPSGQKIALVKRSLKDIFRGKGNGYIAHGIEEGVAAWQIETLLLSKAKARGISCIAVKVRDDGALYITTLQRFMDESKVVTRNKKNGSLQRGLPMQRWRKREGMVKL